jgi:cytochrome d ubiquinol oxidase subunit I
MEFPVTDWPPVAASFLAYHNMVLLGVLMLLLMLQGLYLLARRRIETHRTFLRLAVLAIPLPHVAIQLGWATAEVGRQPWIVYGLMRTSDGVSPVVGWSDVLFSLILFGGLYALLFVLWLGVLVKEIQHGPAPAPAGDEVVDEAEGADRRVGALRPASGAGTGA